jgi:Flp pilus assembly pilin Flp
MHTFDPTRRTTPSRQRGVTTLEYIVLAAVLVIGLVAGVSMFKGKVGEGLSSEGEAISLVARGQSKSVGDRYGDGAGAPGAGGPNGAAGAGVVPEARLGGITASGHGPRGSREFLDTDGDGTNDQVKVEGSLAGGSVDGSHLGGNIRWHGDGELVQGSAQAGAKVDNGTLSGNVKAEGNLATGKFDLNVADVLGYQAEGQLGHVAVDGSGGIGVFGGGAKGKAEAAVAQGKSAWYVGDQVNPFLRVEGEGKALSAEAAGDALIGYDGRRIGLAGSGKAGASALDGRGGAEINIPIPWTGLSFRINGGVSGSVGDAPGGGAGAHAFYDTETGRVNLGGFGELKFLGGLGGDLNLSFGSKPKTRE